MNLLDLAILLPIAFFAYKGYRNGIVWEVLSIIGVIFAVFIAFQFMEQLAGMVEPYIDQPKDIITLISGAILFAATLILVLTIALLIRKFLEFLRLNLVNRLFGLIFGGLKAGIVISAVLLLLAGFNVPDDETRTGSLSYAYVIQVAPAVYNLITSVYPESEDFVNKIRNTLDETNPIKNLSIFY